MNPADKRLSELLDKWLTSLELHLKYSSLDEETYRKVQPWPPHERPSRWIVELALQKVRQLREHQASRIDMGDVKFADALEQMSFLTNLVGSQHIRRFVPLAEPQTEVDVGPMVSQEPTREMTQPKVPRTKSTGTHKIAAAKKSSSAKTAKTAEKTADKAGGKDKTADKMVIDDAKRLLGWGRKWHELPELISRMAGRPTIAEVRRVLRDHKHSLD